MDMETYIERLCVCACIDETIIYVYVCPQTQKYLKVFPGGCFVFAFFIGFVEIFWFRINVTHSQL